MHNITLNDGRRVTYFDEGHGSVLLFIHGFPLDSTVWTPQIEGLRSRHRVIAPDLAGFGDSSMREVTTMDGYADDLAHLMKGIGVESATLIGLSMGGYVAFAFWRRYRDRVRALVLSGTRAGPDSEETRQARYALAERVGTEGVAPVIEAMLPKMLVVPAGMRYAVGLEKVRGMMARQRPDAVAAALRAMAARTDSTPYLPAIDVPTLIIVGDNDTVTPTEEAEAMAAAVPEARLLVFPNAAHLANLDRPELFNQAVGEFMRELMI
jgi:pimeloyl-ACP methyl ester carboxylesterase